MKLQATFIKSGKILFFLRCYFFLIFVVPFAGISQAVAAEGEIMNLSAPPLGITSSGAILLWDDTDVPDCTDMVFPRATKMYYIYLDGIKVGSTSKRSFPVKGLTPSKTYTLTVKESEDVAGISKEENSIQVTTKKAGEVFNVRKYGAKGDGKKRDTDAIQKAIKACTKGGKVVIPAGTYLVGHIELKSDMTFELRKDAVLKFIGYKEGGVYPVTIAELPGPDGNVDYKSNSLITGYNVHNVTITGEGTINANGETWWPFARKVRRPFTIEFIQSSNILVQGITIQDPPHWNNHLVYVDNAIYSDVKFFKVSSAPGTNGDGLNPDASHNILIVGCLFGNQDDSIAIKSGNYLSDGKKRRRSSEYITIRDCIFDRNSAAGASPLGIGIGSEISGGVKHVIIQNCEFIDTSSLLNVKTNRERPFAFVEDIRIECCTYRNTRFIEKHYNRAPISLDLFYYGRNTNADSVMPVNPGTPIFRNIHFKNITIENPKGKFAYLCGLLEQKLKNIKFENITGSSKQGIYGRNIERIDLVNVRLKVQEGKVFNWTNVKNITQSLDQSSQINLN